MSDVVERIEAKLDKSAGQDGCWLWTASVGQKGQPRTTIKKKCVSPRRVIWEHVHGEELPANRQVATTCKVPRCLNPAHLYLRPWMDDVARFWTFVEKGDGDACWLWTGATFRRGYGAFWMNEKVRHAHRLAYELEMGVTLDDREVFVCHHCDNPSCVRPSHMFLGTAADNNADMHAKGRYSQGAAHAAACMVGKRAATPSMGAARPCGCPEAGHLKQCAAGRAGLGVK